MKINIFIPKADATKGIVDPSNYSTWPDHQSQSSHVQVSITPDEFARLEDESKDPMGPAISVDNMNELESRIYKESQTITGGDFSNWYNSLTEEELETYNNIYGH
tara:strand:- start:2074 stop:2388 length:315 start_codon:yes stop_codon:yes gene_type:complete